MTSPMDERPTGTVDLDALSDLCTPWCLHVAATLRLADRLESGPVDLADLAAAAGCDAESLGRLLRHLIHRGVFAEVAPGRFALNGAAAGLLDPARRLVLDLEGFGGRMAHSWSSLLTAVRTGNAAYHERFGRSFWADLNAHPAIGASFDALMGPEGHGVPDPRVLVSGDWRSVRSVVDVGGGTGALLVEILRDHPGVRGTLVDLPRTAAAASALFEQAGLADRATAIGQSFFDPLPAGADLYILSKVLNDWPDADATRLLRRCADAARPRGRVAVVGGVSPDEVGPPAPELLMLILLGGKNRSLSALRVLAEAAGLQVDVAGRLPSGQFSVELRPG